MEEGLTTIHTPDPRSTIRTPSGLTTAHPAILHTSPDWKVSVTDPPMGAMSLTLRLRGGSRPATQTAMDTEHSGTPGESPVPPRHHSTDGRGTTDAPGLIPGQPPIQGETLEAQAHMRADSRKRARTPYKGRSHHYTTTKARKAASIRPPTPPLPSHCPPTQRDLLAGPATQKEASTFDAVPAAPNCVGHSRLPSCLKSPGSSPRPSLRVRVLLTPFSPLLPAPISPSPPALLRPLARPPDTPRLAPDTPPTQTGGGIPGTPLRPQPPPRAPGGTRPRILLVFSGPGESEQALMHLLRARGHTVTAIDTKLGGHAHDVLGPLGDDLHRRILTRQFDTVFLAPPCSSFSVHHGGKLRSRAQPDGVLPIPEEWQAYLTKHNALASLAARLFTACHLAGIPVAAENPADRSDPDSPAHWKEREDHGSLWRTSAWSQATRDTAASPLTFAQCAFNSAAQKWTTILASPLMLPALSNLGSGAFRCTHGLAPHRVVLTGRDEWGRSRTALAAAYPPALDLFLADALGAAALAHLCDPNPVTRATPRPPCDGIAAAGPALGPTSQAACESARLAPLGFSSPRALIPSSEVELRREALPGDLHAPVTSSKPCSNGKTLRRKSLFPDQGRAPLSDQPPAPPLPPSGLPKGAPHGPIPIQDLFLGDVYRDQVQTWLALADTAVKALRQGRKPPKVPTRTILQDQLQPWAQGVVWDCTTPTNCKPVVRSDRNTVFPGKRQTDRAALRRVAALLDWHDTDLLDQIGEGGIEVRSSCEPAIVLVFHHDSLLTALPMAEKSVAAHLKEEWVSPLSRHLPFVPCRLQPHGVVLQSRTRISPDGSVEEYDKPRITTDASFGGVDSVNAGVKDLDRAVCLPTVQQLGRGWAICDTAYPKSSTRGTSAYCVDAESAYSFMCMQRADWWMQVSVWWDPITGVCGFMINYRMGFGGAFAPNRFERGSTLAAAYAQYLQRQFDREQPPPPSAQRWSSDRRALQRDGLLPQGEAQCTPAYLQVYIDDFTGAAGNDAVTSPPCVDHITMDPDGMTTLGCGPAPADSRVMVHAKLCILALAHLGLHAAPQKTMCGCPLIALGMRLDVKRGIIDCPPNKRTSVLFDIRRQRAMATSTRGIMNARVRRLVGRLCNLSQVTPALRPVLHGGYALCVTEWLAAASTSSRGPADVTLSERGTALADWINLLDTADALISDNKGVALAPRLRAPRRDGHGSVTCVTDASGIHGFGGYAFAAHQPNTVYLTSEYWPTEALDALEATADPNQAHYRRTNQLGKIRPSFPMPAGELYAAILMPTMLARSVHIRTCFAVGDCDPAVRTLRSSHSGHPQMRRLVNFASEAAFTWVPAHVPREANSDADRLSHPELLGDVTQDLEKAGFTVLRLRPTASDWALLEDTIALYKLAQARKAKKGKKRGRRSAFGKDTREPAPPSAIHPPGP